MQRFVNRWSVIALRESVAARHALNANKWKRGEATLANEDCKENEDDESQSAEWLH